MIRMDKKVYLSVLAALATVAVAWLLILLAAPIIKPTAVALIIGIATFPYHTRLSRKFPNNPERAAGLMILSITACFILPVAALITTVVQNAANGFTEVQRIVLAIKTTGADPLSQPPLIKEINALAERFGVDLSDHITKLISNASGVILELTTNAAKGLGEFFFTLVVALFILFFIYRDGERIVSSAVNSFASNQEKARYYISAISNTTIAVTIGTIFTCFVQGITAGIGYYFAGVPAPILFGVLTALAAIVPVVGTGVIWIPIVVLFAIYGAYLKALLLALWCVVLVVIADNAIRPLAIVANINISVLAIVLGAICGVFTMGILGLILGPVIFAVLINVWQDATAADNHAHVASNVQDKP